MSEVVRDQSGSGKRSRLAVWIIATLLVCALMGVALTKSRLLNAPQSSNAGQHDNQQKSGDAEVLFACPGRVEGMNEVSNINAGVDGVLTTMNVKEGQHVMAGEILARIDCHNLEAELRAAQAKVDMARQARQRLLRGSRDEERRVAADKLAEAEAVWQQADLHSQRMARLFGKGDISREALERARRDAEVAAANRRAAADQQTLVNAPPLPEETARADAEINAAEEQVRVLAAKLGRCVVKAPMAGTVLRCYLKPGEAVSTVFPQPIVSLADTSQLRVRAEVDERDVSRVHPDQRVLILIDAFPLKHFAGSVSRVGTLMGRKKVRTGDPAEKSDQDILEVLIDLKKVDEPLAIGLRATVQFYKGKDLSPDLQPNHD